MEVAAMKKNKNYLFFITPAFILYTIFVAFPIVYVLYLGFTDWSGMGETNFVCMTDLVADLEELSFCSISCIVINYYL